VLRDGLTILPVRRSAFRPSYPSII